jgi:hypothetical protein
LVVLERRERKGSLRREGVGLECGLRRKKTIIV